MTTETVSVPMKQQIKVLQGMIQSRCYTPEGNAAMQAGIDAMVSSLPFAGIGTLWKDLHPETILLVRRFAYALAEKLLAAQVKYGYSDGWKQSDWMDE